MTPTLPNWHRLNARQALLWADETLGQGLANRCLAWGLADLSALPQSLRAAWVEARGPVQCVVDREEPRQQAEAVPAVFEELSWPDEASFRSWLAQWASAEGPDLVLAAGAVGPGRTGWALRSSGVVTDQAGLGRLARRFWASLEGQPLEPNPAETFPSVPVTDNGVGELKDPPPQAALLGAERRSAGAPLEVEVRRLPGVWTEDGLTAAAAAWLCRFSGQREMVVSADRPADLPKGESWGHTEYLRLSLEASDSWSAVTVQVAAARERHRAEAVGALSGRGLSSLHLTREILVPHGVVRPVTWAPASVAVQADRFDALSLQWDQKDDHAVLTFGFHAATYPESRRRALADGFLRLARSLRDQPDLAFDAIELLDGEERKALRRWGRGAEPALAPDLVDAIAAQTLRTPEAVAVEFGTKALTYREFGRLTDTLARRLQSLGVGPETTVAVVQPRGFGEIGAMLATLKAGGAYVPIDPSHPVDRVRVVLEDAAPQVLLAPPGSPLREALPATTKFLELTDLLSLETKDEPSVRAEVAADAVAYVLFTSGSTGRPKGVEVPRNALANFLQSMAREPGLTSADRVLAITTTTFDISGLELWLPLTVGATVVIADRETAGDPALLKEFTAVRRVTLMQATPATWRMLLEAGWKGQASLKMLCGGEAMNLSLARRLHDCGAELWNVYGPTETTIWSTLDLVPRDTDRITVGHAIDHTQITLRDTVGRLVPQGTIGEICLGGRGLARGYKGRPDLTAEKFPTDPETEERYYKTGDLGRMLPDGRLECLGRVDHQIKVRGFRIEPADIETQLRAVPGVQEVLVVAHQPPAGETLLVLYWVGTATRQELHTQAKARLPYYMVPSAYLNVPFFPLSTAGKIDRKQLPVPEAEAAGQAEGRPPRDDREVLMASVWKEVLGLTFVPMDQDFFALGGTSIRAISLRTKVRERFGVELPLRALFANPTAEGLLTQLEGPADSDSPIIWQAKPGQEAPWIGLLGVSLYAELASCLPEQAGFTAVHVPARYLPGKEPFPTVEQLGEKYLAVVRQIQPAGPYRLMGLCHGGVVAFEVAWLLEQQGETVETVAILDAALPSSLTKLRWRQGLAFLKDPAYFFPKPRPARESDQDGKIDVPVAGAEADADLLRYERVPRRIRAELLNVRATGGDDPVWYRRTPDLGWKNKADLVKNFALSGTHLGILKAPHAAEVAAILQGLEKPKQD